MSTTRFAPTIPDHRPVAPYAIPAVLRERPQWVKWAVGVRSRGSGRRAKSEPTKIPSIAESAGQRADTTDPTTWRTFDEALAESERGKYGIGYVFSADDPYTGVDLDDCRDPETGSIAEWAWDIIRALNTYTEVSPSGTGVKLIGRSVITGERRRDGKIEMYDRERYFALTGQHVAGTPADVNDMQDALDALYARLFPAKPQPAPHPASTAVSLDDQAIIDAAERINPKFAGLWRGDITGYPSHSEARAALVYIIIGFTKDAAQAERLFSLSGLYREDKWPRERDKLLGDALRDVTWQYEPPSTARLVIPRAERKGVHHTFTDAEPTENHDNVMHYPSPISAELSDQGKDLTLIAGEACVLERAEIARLRADVQQLRDQNAALGRIIAAKDTELEHLRERLGTTTETLSLDAQVRGNHHLKANESLVVLNVINEASAVGAQPGQPTLMRLREVTKAPRQVDPATGEIVDGKGVVSKQTAARIIERCEAAGLWKVHDVPRYDASGVFTDKYIELLASPEETKRRAAVIELERKQHGGAGNRYRPCEQHPDAGVIVSRVTRCAKCKKITDEAIINDLSAAPFHLGTVEPTIPLVADTLLTGVNLERQPSAVHDGTVSLEDRILQAIDPAYGGRALDLGALARAAHGDVSRVRREVDRLVRIGKLKRWADNTFTLPLPKQPDWRSLPTASLPMMGGGSDD